MCTYLYELGVHELGGAHAGALVHLAVVDHGLAAVHGLVVGAGLGLDHVGGLHAREGRVGPFELPPTRQHHGAGLRHAGVLHVHLRSVRRRSDEL